MPRTHAGIEGLELGVADGGTDDGDAAGIAPELGEGIEGDVVVAGIGRGRHHDVPPGSDPALQQPVFRDAGVRDDGGAGVLRRKPRGVIDVVVAIAGQRRRLELRRPGAGGIGDRTALLGAAALGVERARRRQSRNARTGQEGAAADHVTHGTSPLLSLDLREHSMREGARHPHCQRTAPVLFVRAPNCYHCKMTKQQIAVLLERAETWSQEAQDELVRTALEIEKKHAGVYQLDEDELADISEGLAEIERGDVASEEEVRTTFDDLRRA